MSLLRSKKVLLFIGIILFVAFTTFLSLLQKPQETPTTIFPTPTPVQINKPSSLSTSTYEFSPFQKTQIGKTTEQEAVAKTTVLKKEALSDGSVKYDVPSVNALQPDQIISKNGIVIYEKTSTFTNKQGGFPKLSSLVNLFNPSEMELRSHPFYGPFVTTYIFAYKGLAIVGNPNTDEVYEVQRFSPQSIDSYLKIYGKDLSLTPTPPGPEIDH